MTVNLSYMLKSASGQILPSLANCLRKAAAHAEATKVAEDVFLGARLYPDMFPVTRQVQIACDQITRGTARLAGLDLPSFPDVETSFSQLIERCEKANAYCQAAPSEAIDARSDATISVPIGGMERTFVCKEFLSGFILPNLHFHAATAYGILRHNGVALGKRDFLSPAG